VVDLRVARALKAMREQPAQPWCVKRLAKLAGASRASFARLFQRATGKSPKRWLRGHRLELVAARLVSSDQTLAEIAAQVGYVSEFALSRAFKRHFGVAPAHYRQTRLVTRCAA
jgi:transcriptional regulator GlxA family with amidase domain